MSARFEELDWQETPIGAISLRRRRDPVLDVDVYEVKLDDEYLMSSLFTTAEVELARLGLAELTGGSADVLVGGLGLGCTAAAALDDDRVRSLTVVEGLAEVVDWHHRGLLPLSGRLTGDPRTALVHGDFFALAAAGDGLDPAAPGRRFDVIMVDIDHSPRHVLAPSHEPFYTVDGLRRLAAELRPSGVFALWSDDPPDEEFRAALGAVFTRTEAHTVAFDNPYGGPRSANTVYVAAL